MDKVGLEMNDENLFKFMFCLESAYSLFTRLILAKACEDYKLPDIDFSGFKIRFVISLLEAIFHSWHGR